jgi:hypothetical protein
MNVIVQQGADSGHTMSSDRGLVSIGRGAECDLVLHEAQASRQHAELRRYGDQWLVVDLGSTNGTIVNGVRLTPHVARPVTSGATVVIGGTHLELDEPEGWDAPAQVTAVESPLWSVGTWTARGIVGVGCIMAVAGSLSEWIEIQVRLPVVPIGINRSFGGTDSGFAWLFIGLAVVALMLAVMDMASRRWGLAAGLGQALLPAAALVSVAMQVRQYYQAGTQKFLGISLVDVLTKYAKDVVDITPKLGIYALGVGVVALIVGGLLRLIVAGLEPTQSRT